MIDGPDRSRLDAGLVEVLEATKAQILRGKFCAERLPIASETAQSISLGVV